MRVYFTAALPAAFFALLLAHPAQASSTERRLQRVERQLNESERTQKKLEQESAALDRELPELREKLISATSAADKASGQLQELEENLADLEGTATRKAAQLEEQRASLSQTLALLQRLALTPPAVQLLSPAPPLERLRSDLQIKALLPEINRRSKELAEALSDLRLLRKRLESQRSRVLLEQKSHDRQRSELDKLLAERGEKLKQTRAQSAALTGKLDKLAAEAGDLRTLLDRLDDEQNQDDESSGLKLAALPDGAARRLPLSAPALVRFGQNDRSGGQSKGMTLRPRPGAVVAAVARGRVAFAGPFRGYGTMVILVHGGNFHSVVAGLEKANVAVGESVAAGEPLGVMPASRSPAPELYFEVRREGTPIDPLGKAAAQLTGR